MDPQSQTMTEFEFGELSMGSHRRYGAIRPVLGFFCVTFGGFMAWFVFLSRAGGGFHDSTQWLVFSTVEVTLGLLIGLFLILAWGSRQGATGLRVGEEGIVIRWRYGYEEAFPWSRLADRCFLVDFSPNPIMVRSASRFLWELHVSHRPWSCVPREAYEEILRAAANQGYIVTTRPRIYSYLTRPSCSVVQIRAADADPRQ